MFEISTHLTPEVYLHLYESVGWTAPELSQIQIALEQTHFTVCINYSGEPIGMGRVIGDGAISFYVKDVAVLPAYQGQGIGKLIMKEIFSYIRETIPENTGVSVELIASEGVEEFYETFGFGKKPGDGMGHGMMAYVTNSNA